MKPKKRASKVAVLFSQDVLDLERSRAYAAGVIEGKKQVGERARYEEQRTRVEALGALRREVERGTMNISGYDKAVVLAALYNAARPQGLGFLHYTPEDMTVAQARRILDSGETYFDYYKGRVMKVDLSTGNLDTRLYNRDNGSGAAEFAILAAIYRASS